MKNIPLYDMYDFIDDGVNESIYTMLNRYHPDLKKDFSLSNLLNHLPELGSTDAQIKGFSVTYEKDFAVLADILADKTKKFRAYQEQEEAVSDEERNGIFSQLQAICKGIPECQNFSTVKEYTDFAKTTVASKNMKPLRDVIVSHAVNFLPEDKILFMRTVLLKNAYLAKALEKAKEVDHKTRKPGEYPEIDKLQAIGKILMRNNGLQEYDEFFGEAQAKIREAALKAMEKARIESVCEIKRKKSVRSGINSSISKDAKEAEKLPISSMFEELKRKPMIGENRWAYESLKKPELLCDLEANYSNDGIENQRVIAFRLGKLKYKNPVEMEGFNIDRTAEMPELIGVTRMGNDGNNTYFVLMPPIDRLTFRPVGEIPQDPGEKPYSFTITKDVQVTTRSGLTRIERRSEVANIVDSKTGQKLNAFKNKEIPENLKEFFAKVYFSDEYLSNAIENNARYIGSVVETDNGPQIRTADVEKYDLAAAHYAALHQGTVDKIQTRSFESYCSSFELELKQYNLINAYQRKQAREANKKKDEDAR